MTQDSRRETSSDAAPKGDPKFARIREIALRFFRHIPECKFVAPLVYGELADSVRYLSRKDEACQARIQRDKNAKLLVHLLAQNGEETGVELGHSALACEPGETAD